jgi:hypothetical protein
MSLVVTVDSDGRAHTHGTVQIKDGTSNTVLIAEGIPTAASCDDIDGDGVAGFTHLQFVMRDVRSSDLVPVSVIPASGEIDESGEEPVIMVIGDTTFAERVRSHVWGFPTRPPK